MQLGDRVVQLEQHLADADAKLERLQDNIAKLLAAVAQFSRPCRGCQKLVWFVYQQKTGKYLVYEKDGQPHYGRLVCQSAQTRELLL
jgi:hypothetical protein